MSIASLLGPPSTMAASYYVCSSWYLCFSLMKTFIESRPVCLKACHSLNNGVLVCTPAFFSSSRPSAWLPTCLSVSIDVFCRSASLFVSICNSAASYNHLCACCNVQLFLTGTCHLKTCTRFTRFSMGLMKLFQSMSLSYAASWFSLNT